MKNFDGLLEKKTNLRNAFKNSCVKSAGSYIYST